MTRKVRMPWPLLAVLTVQAALSGSLVRTRTAFGDEALYLSAGHLEWSHWLHGTQIPAYQTWFSGAPVIYPPLGAIADSLGGLAAARLLSLVFMLGVTWFAWSTAARLLAVTQISRPSARCWHQVCPRCTASWVLPVPPGQSAAGPGGALSTSNWSGGCTSSAPGPVSGRVLKQSASGGTSPCTGTSAVGEWAAGPYSTVRPGSAKTIAG